MANAQNFKTLPNQAGMGPPMQQPPPAPQTGPNTPAHQRHVSQTMNPRRSLANPGGNGLPMPPEPQVYDAPNCDYDPPSYMDQNFGNPYDCPEGMYNGSMMSSVGYSQVSDHAVNPGPMQFPPRGGQPLPGMT